MGNNVHWEDYKGACFVNYDGTFKGKWWSVEDVRPAGHPLSALTGAHASAHMSGNLHTQHTNTYKQTQMNTLSALTGAFASTHVGNTHAQTTHTLTHTHTHTHTKHTLTHTITQMNKLSVLTHILAHTHVSKWGYTRKNNTHSDTLTHNRKDEHTHTHTHTHIHTLVPGAAPTNGYAACSPPNRSPQGLADICHLKNIPR